MKKILIFLGIAVVAVGLNSSVFAMNCGGHSADHSATTEISGGHGGHGGAASAEQTSKAIVYSGNEVCPVTGEKIGQKAMVTSEYEGKIYNFCCAACIDTFKKDPERYLKDMK